MVVAPRADVISCFLSLSLWAFACFWIWVVSDKEGRTKEQIVPCDRLSLAIAFSRSSLFLLRGEAADDL